MRQPSALILLVLACRKYKINQLMLLGWGNIEIMTIAVIWQEDDLLWSAADTRLVVGGSDRTTSEITAKIYSIAVSISALHPGLAGLERRQPHYWTQYGFVYAGAVLPASQTAVTASTLLQNLARPGDRGNPPTFEEISEFLRRLASRFMAERRSFAGECQSSDEGLFSAAFFGWCPYESQYKIGHIEGRSDAGGFRVELSYPPRPQTDGEPWLVLGSGRKAFNSLLAEYRRSEKDIAKRIPHRVIDLMVAEDHDPTVGGAISIGAAHERGFELFYTAQPILNNHAAARRLFNGLDLDTEVGAVGQYIVATNGIA
ncbi:hypothetical protein [Alsobacter sp. R-9]